MRALNQDLVNSRNDHSRMIIYCNGSGQKSVNDTWHAGYGLVGFIKGQKQFSIAIGLGPHAIAYNGEVFACQDMIFLNLYFDQFYVPSLNTFFFFHFANIPFMTLMTS